MLKEPAKLKEPKVKEPKHIETTIAKTKCGRNFGEIVDSVRWLNRSYIITDNRKRVAELRPYEEKK